MSRYSYMNDLPNSQLKSRLVSEWKSYRTRNREEGETSFEDGGLSDRLLTAFKRYRTNVEKSQEANALHGDEQEGKGYSKSAWQSRRTSKGASASRRPSRRTAKHGTERRRGHPTKGDDSDETGDDELQEQILKDLELLFHELDDKPEREKLMRLKTLAEGILHLSEVMEARGDISSENDDPGLETKILNGMKRMLVKLRTYLAHPDRMRRKKSKHHASMLYFLSKVKAGRLSSDSEEDEPPKKNPLDRLTGRQSADKADDPTLVSSDGPNDHLDGQPLRVHAVRNPLVSEEGYHYGMVKETTAWDVYNNEARKVDNELVKDWRESLNSLLLFTAIFAAVLAAFIIESKKMLLQDSTDLLAAIALWSLNNNGNTTNLPYVPDPFVPTWAAVSINSLLFASLGVTLIAALASVVALQWVADYDAAITRGGSSSEDQAKRRQFRFAGIVDWKMGEIIAALPLLLYSSVALFWAGAIPWMWSINEVVGCVVAGSTAIAGIFYVVTTFLGTVSATAPFRTPLSRGLYWVLRPSVMSARRLFSRASAKMREQWITLTGGNILSRLRDHLRHFNIHLPSVSTKGLLQWINEHIIPKATSRRREDEAAGANPKLRQEALDWLVQHLPVSADSHPRLLLLITEFLNRSSQSSTSPVPSSPPSLNEAWLNVLNFLGWHYMRRILENKLEEKNFGTVGLLIRCFTAPEIRNHIEPSSDYEKDPAKAEYWSQFCITAEQLSKIEFKPLVNVAFLLSRDVPIPLKDSKPELAATINLIKWRNSTNTTKTSIWREVFDNTELYSPEYLQECLRCFKLWRFAAANPEPWEELVQTVEAFDELIKIDADPKFHVCLVRLLSEYSKEAAQQSYNTPGGPESLTQRFNLLRDPCLAILGGYGYGVPVTAGVAMTNIYMNKYSSSLELVQSLILSKFRVDDSPAVWQLRAAIAGTAPTAIIKFFFRAARDLGWLLCVERLFQHPVHCIGHSLGPQHLLYHFSCDNRSLFGFKTGKLLFGSDLGEARAHPTLVFLAFPGREYTSFVAPESDLNLICAERIRQLCEDMMQDPAAFVTLVTDIASGYLQYECKPQSVALILKAAENVMSLPLKDEIIHLLSLLTQALSRVRRKMIRHKDCPFEEVYSMSRHAKRICSQLKFISTTRVISSRSHTRMLSCARSYGSRYAAVGWLPMYEGTSRDEMRLGEFNGTRTLVDVRHRWGDKYYEMSCAKESDHNNAAQQGSLRHHIDLVCAHSSTHGLAARGWRGMYID